MKTISLFAIGFLTIYSCSTGGSGGNNSGSLDTIKTKNVDSEPPKKTNDQLMENKMKANAETVEGMLMIQQIIKNFWNTSEDNRNYAALGEELSIQTDYIIKNCSMKGADHDELHKILHPILEQINLVKNAGSYEEANDHIKEIETLTNEFFKRFELENPPA